MRKALFMVKNKKTILAYLLCGAVLLAVLGAFCMSLAIVSDYSSKLGYFERGSVKAGLLYAVLAASVVLAAGSWLLFRKTVPERSRIPTPMYTKIVSGVLIIALLWHMGTTLLSLFHAGTSSSQHYWGHPLPYWCLLLSSNIFALLFILYLICDIAPGKARNSSLAVCSSFFPPFYAAAQLFIIYFDENSATNSPVKIIYQLMYISFMLFLTATAGLSLGRKSVFCRYLFSLIFTVIIGGTVSISAILGLVTETPGYNMAPSQLACCFGMTAYALCRFLSLALSDSVVLKSSEEVGEKV